MGWRSLPLELLTVLVAIRLNVGCHACHVFVKGSKTQNGFHRVCTCMVLPVLSFLFFTSSYLQNFGLRFSSVLVAKRWSSRSLYKQYKSLFPNVYTNACSWLAKFNNLAVICASTLIAGPRVWVVLIIQSASNKPIILQIIHLYNMSRLNAGRLISTTYIVNTIQCHLLNALLSRQCMLTEHRFDELVTKCCN